MGSTAGLGQSLLLTKSISNLSAKHLTETMKLICLRLAALALAIPNAVASNLRQSKSTKEWRLFELKSAKQSYATPSTAEATSGYDSKAGKTYSGYDSKAGKTKATRRPAGKSTNNDGPCGAFWHRSLNPLNSDSCTNDSDLPHDSSKLYSTVEDCCRAEFGRVNGCNVYNVCRPTSIPSPSPTRKFPCGVYWHRSQSDRNPNACTNDANLPDDPSKLYDTVEECCRNEFGQVHGCSVIRDTCDNHQSSNPTPFTGDEFKSPTGSPTNSQRTHSPTQSPVAIPVTDPDSPPPSGLLRKSMLSDMSKLLHEHSHDSVEEAGIQTKKALEDALHKYDIDPEEFKGIIASTSQLEDFLWNASQYDLVATNTTTESQSSDSVDAELLILDQNELQCKCVNCAEDLVCGGLWKGNTYSDEVNLADLDPEIHIHMIISHCKSPLDWLEEFIEGFRITSLHIVTKCGFPIVGAPQAANIIELPNVGRCDHTYAWYISNVLPSLVVHPDSIVVFTKDDISVANMHQLGEWSELRHLTRLAGSERGFACGINSMDVKFSQSRFALSAFHETKTLSEFSMDSYQRNLKGYALDSTEFKSKFETLGLWWESLGIKAGSRLSPVCYGGVFAASARNIYKNNDEFWQSLTSNLSRGNNIQEGHYAERSWALLLTYDLPDYQVNALIEHADGVYVNTNSMNGALMQLPKLFLHVGAKATSSTEILSESLIDHMHELKLDGYQLAVHGKYDPTKSDFLNVDRLASCLWSDQVKQSFPKYLHEATVCPDDLLPELTRYMEKAVKDHQDMIILNPWLSRRGTADSLALYLDPVWDVHVSIYYRRYYEWLLVVFKEWRSEIMEHAMNLGRLPFSSFRFIDFIREYNKRLFYGKGIHEDGYPIRQFGGMKSNALFDNDAIADHFDSTSNVADLTDLTDYTYFVAQEYSSNPRFRRHLSIVNIYDGSIDTNFFCHVLHDAHNACKSVAKELDDSHVQTESARSEFTPMTTEIIEDLVIAAYKSGKIRSDSNMSSKDIPSQLRLWVDEVRNAFQQSDDLSENDISIECLYDFEVDRLLEVSLAYEKILLPAFYDSPNGATNLIREFQQWKFCSVDTEKVLNDSQWDILWKSTTILSRFRRDEPV